jgi:hypothetical protein
MEISTGRSDTGRKGIENKVHDAKETVSGTGFDTENKGT